MLPVVFLVVAPHRPKQIAHVDVVLGGLYPKFSLYLRVDFTYNGTVFPVGGCMRLLLVSARAGDFPSRSL